MICANSRQAGRRDQIGTGRAARRGVGAGFERDVERRTLCRVPRHHQRDGFGMGPPTGLGPAAADDAAILDHDRPDRRIGPTQRPPARCQRGGGGEPIRIWVIA